MDDAGGFAKDVGEGEAGAAQQSDTSRAKASGTLELINLMMCGI